MRFLCCCSAALLFAGCGSTKTSPVFTTSPVSHSASVRLENITFGGIHGLLAVSTKPGKHPAVLFLHGSGGSDQDFLVSAARFAQSGGVGLTISQPNNATSFTPLVRNARRALDVLASLPDVDPNRLAVAGLSLGAETAAIVAGEDKRPVAFSLMSCRGESDVTGPLSTSHADFYVQNGLRDEIIPEVQLRATISAIRGKVKVQWYDTPHTLDDAAFRDQLAWLRAELHPSR